MLRAPIRANIIVSSILTLHCTASSALNYKVLHCAAQQNQPKTVTVLQFSCNSWQCTSLSCTILHFMHFTAAHIYFAMLYSKSVSSPPHCEIVDSCLQQSHQHHVFRAYIEAEPHSQAGATIQLQIFCLISRSKLTDSVVTYNISLQYSAR